MRIDKYLRNHIREIKEEPTFSTIIDLLALYQDDLMSTRSRSPVQALRKQDLFVALQNAIEYLQKKEAEENENHKSSGAASSGV